MESARSKWNDERLDAQFEHIDERFDLLSGQVRDLERRMERGFDRVDARFEGMETRIDARLDALQRTMILSMTSILLAFAAQIVFGS